MLDVAALKSTYAYGKLRQIEERERDKVGKLREHGHAAAGRVLKESKDGDPLYLCSLFEKL